MINQIGVPDDYQEIIPNEDEDDQSEPKRNELTYLHGVLYLEKKGSVTKWVFESYKDVFQMKQYADLPLMLAEVY